MHFTPYHAKYFAYELTKRSPADSMQKFASTLVDVQAQVETKGTKDFEKLRGAEADKVKCGRKHFEALKVDFDVVVEAKEIQ